MSYYVSEEISDLEKEVLSLKRELNTIKAENKFLRDALARISGVVYEYYCSEGRFVSSKMDRVDVQRIAQVLEECGI